MGKNVGGNHKGLPYEILFLLEHQVLVIYSLANVVDCITKLERWIAFKLSRIIGVRVKLK